MNRFPARRSVIAPVVAGLLALTPLAPQPQGGSRTFEELLALPLEDLVAALPDIEEERKPVPDRNASGAALVHRLRAGAQLPGELWKRALLDTRTLRVRERWPVGEPYSVSLRQPRWLQGMQLVLEPVRSDVPLRAVSVGTLDGTWCGTCDESMRARWAHQELGHLPLGPQTIPLRLELRARAGAERASTPERGIEAVVLATSEIVLDVTVVPTLDDALPAVASPAVDAAVRETLWLRDRSSYPRLHADAGRSDDPPLAGLARVLTVELLVGDEVRERIVLRPTEEDFFREQGHPLRSARARWTVRVRGSDDGILRSWGCDRRWTGEVVLTLDELLDRGYALGR